MELDRQNRKDATLCIGRRFHLEDLLLKYYFFGIFWFYSQSKLDGFGFFEDVRHRRLMWVSGCTIFHPQYNHI